MNKSKNKSNGFLKLELKTFRKSIADHHKKIEILNKEIEKIQDKCPHDEGWEDTTYYWAPAHGTPGKTCNICDKFISSINPLLENMVTTINDVGLKNDEYDTFDLDEQKFINDEENKNK